MSLYSSGGAVYFSQPPPTYHQHLSSPATATSLSSSSMQNEGDWVSLGTMVQLDTPVCSLAIDPYDEYVWLGHSNGRVTSYTYPEGDKHCSFRSFDESLDVKQMMIQQDNVLSLSSNSFHIHTKGGIPQWSFSHEDFNDQLLAFTGLYHSHQKTVPYSSYASANYSSFSKVVLGGTLNTLFSVDLNVGQITERVDTSQGVCILKSSGRYVATGGINGELALRDPRTLRAEHTFDVHTGSISDVEVKGDLLVTCGFTNRYGEYYVDPVVKAFDLRSTRMLGQIHFPAGPAFLKFHPMFSSLLAIVSQTGYAQFRDIQSEITTTPGIEFSSSDNTVYTIDTQGEVVESFEMSSSGEVMMFGDSGGRLHVFSLRSLQSEEHNSSRLNSSPMMRDEDPDMPDGMDLLSNWPTTYTTLIGQHPPEIHPQILANLRTVTNPYSNSTYGIALNPGLKKPQDGYLERKTFMNYMKIDRMSHTKRFKDLNVIPRDYDFIESHVNNKTRGYKEFDFGKYNKTAYTGLDNQQEHTQYCNAFIHVIYHLHRDLRTAIMNHTCERPLCLACELGFLFYMFDQQQLSHSSEGVAFTSAGNFLRTLKRLYAEKGIPLGSSSTAKPSQSNMSSGELAVLFNQFIWEQLHEELYCDMYQCPLSYPSIITLPVKHPAMIHLKLPGITTTANNNNMRKNAPHKTKTFQNRDIVDIMLGARSALMDEDTMSYTGESKVIFTHTLKLPPESSSSNITFAQVVTNALNYNILQQDKPDQSNTDRKVLSNLPNILNLSFHMGRDDIRWLRMQHIRRSNFDPNDEQQHFKASSRVSIPPKFTVRYTDDSSSVWRVEDVSYETTTDYSFSHHQKYGRKTGNNSNKRTTDSSSSDSGRSITYSLRAVICEIKHPFNQHNSDDHDHCVAFIRIPNERHELEWYLFNDFTITRHESAFDFSQSWKTPCVLFYVREDIERVIPKNIEFKNPINAERVFSSDFMQVRKNDEHEQQVSKPAHIPEKGEIVSIDAEFVVLETEKQKKGGELLKKSLQEDNGTLLYDQSASDAHQPIFSLGRVSVLLDNSYETLIDDFIATRSETVQDYLTRYSGLKEGDLDPDQSPHNVTHLKSTYMKLRALVDRGVIFVGHGLQNDFRIINIYVPKDQVIDTVELFQLPRQRKISLRFLANFLLHSDIQQETHCSVEDARTALLIYHKYLEYVKKQEFDQLLNDIYTVGRNTNWQISDTLSQKNSAVAGDSPSPEVV